MIDVKVLSSSTVVEEIIQQRLKVQCKYSDTDWKKRTVSTFDFSKNRARSYRIQGKVRETRKLVHRAGD